MRNWNLSTIDVEPQKPVVLDSEDEGRAILINLPAGEQLSEHQVHERAWVLVVSGRARIDLPGGDSAEGGPGLLAIFDPAERHEVSASEDSRILLVLSPWPGVGHPSNRG
ncbi:MAG: hypothetical protein ACR2G3_12400 [Solirubrobacterales bacterium]